jgi:hypothetical protein
MWHKVWAQLRQSGAGRLGVGTISISALPTCQGGSVHRVSNAQSRVQELCQNSTNLDREPTLESLRCIGVPSCWDYPTTLPRSGWFANHSKSFIHYSYVICTFTYRIVELVFVLSYIRSYVWWSIEYIGTQCGNYYLIPGRLTALIRQKILDNAIEDVSEALSMHVVPPAIRIVVVPTEVTALLGLCNPPRSWTGTVGPSLPGLTIAPCVDS